MSNNLLLDDLERLSIRQFQKGYCANAQIIDRAIAHIMDMQNLCLTSEQVYKINFTYVNKLIKHVRDKKPPSIINNEDVTLGFDLALTLLAGQVAKDAVDSIRQK